MAMGAMQFSFKIGDWFDKIAITLMVWHLITVKFIKYVCEKWQGNEMSSRLFVQMTG
jgi:hypothetical protein